MIRIIVAKASNNVIGNNNELMWHLPNDLKHFKQQTINHPVIMGRKTYESLGRALPNRLNIVITRNKQWNDEEIVKANSLEEAIKIGNDVNETVYIIGGGEIYRQAMKTADELIVTEVYQDFDGDTYFPEISKRVWKETSRQDFQQDEKHPYSYSFVNYKRISS